MKNLFAFALALCIFSIPACEKDGNDPENHCPVVDQKLLPATVLAGFQTKYPSETVITWFDKDGIGYCAYFKQNNRVKKLAEFTNDGVFVSEQSGHDDDHSTTTSNPKGGTSCECEVDD